MQWALAVSWLDAFDDDLDLEPAAMRLLSAAGSALNGSKLQASLSAINADEELRPMEWICRLSLSFNSRPGLRRDGREPATTIGKPLLLLAES